MRSIHLSSVLPEVFAVVISTLSTMT